MVKISHTEFAIALITLILQVCITVSIHSCQRSCEDDSGPRVCYYKFELEWYYTLSKACYGCPNNITDCDRIHCVPGDGVERAIVTVNRQLPGPSIQVCEGDLIVVDVKNHIGAESTTIHWHGIHQVGTPHMDGVPMVTQCPIQPHSTFRYQFEAKNPGTHFWHSHSGMQRADGAHGLLIIRETLEKDPHAELYDYDLPEHAVMVSDWMHSVAFQQFAAHHHSNGDNKPKSILVNGKGQYQHKENSSVTNTPLEVFEVESGKRYRFRMASNGILNCPIEFSIDHHNLTVITSDGSPIDPIEVDSLVIYAGERFDFIVNTNNDVKSYWIRLRGLLDCDERFTKAKQVAILRYKGAPNEETPTPMDYNSMKRGGKQLNPLNSGTQGTQISIADVDTLIPDDRTSNPEADVKFYLAYDFNAVDSKHFHHPEHYPIYGIEKNKKLYTPQINDISMILPSSPLLTQPNNINHHMFCNHTSIRKNCSKEYCECVYALNIPLNAVVEMIIIDKGYTFDANHPFHIHGHAFRVVAMEKVGNQVSLEEIKQLDEAGKIKRKLNKAVLKDTVTIPDGGYTVIRFVASNPGYWLLHCHISFHMEVGMAVILKIGEENDFAPPPQDFPTCGDWIPPLPVEYRKSRSSKIPIFWPLHFISIIILLFMKKI